MSRVVHLAGAVGAAAVILAGAALSRAAAPPGAAHVVAAPAWVVDKAASRLSFRGAFAGESFDGTFKRWDAQIAFDPKALDRSHVTVTVDLASAVTGDPTRDQTLPTDDWFAVKRFPKAVFVSRSIRQLGPGRYQVEGDLTIRGVKRPLGFPFVLTLTGRMANMQAGVPIDRTAFGVGQGQFKGADTVAAQVAVGVRLIARRK